MFGKNKHNKMSKSKIYADFVIIGGGTAGCVLASQLATKYRVVLLEAGVDESKNPLITDPLASGNLVLAHTNEFFFGLGHEKGGVVENTRFAGVAGELMGGGSSVNGMQYVRGTPEFFTQWQNYVNDPSWGPDAASSTYKQLETFQGVAGQFDPTNHGYQGPLNVRQGVVNLEAATAFQNALSSLGYPVNQDYNSSSIGSFLYWQLNQTPSEIRASSNTAFLPDLYSIGCNVYKSCSLPCLTVYTKARVTKMRFTQKCCSDKPKAKAVVAIINGVEYVFRSYEKIILSSGFQSPVLLQLFGIGDTSVLQKLCITPIYHNPNVGKHMLNHPIIVLTGVGNVPSPTNPDFPALYSGGAQLPNPTIPGSTTRSLEMIGIATPAGTMANNKLLKAFKMRGCPYFNKYHGRCPFASGSIGTTSKGEEKGVGAFTIATLILDAKSEGTITINNSDPLRMPEFEYNYFGDPSDLATAVGAYKVMYQTLVGMGLTPLGPSESEDITSYILTNYSQAYHWTGSCRMAPSAAEGVVDKDGNVFGVEGLMVADVTVVPFNAAGNTAAPAFLVGATMAKKLLSS